MAAKKDYTESGQEFVDSTAQAFGDAAKSTAESSKKAIDDATQSVSDAAYSAGETGKKLVDDASESIKDAADSVSDSAKSMGENGKAIDETGQELIDEFTNLGYKFVELLEVAWKSDQRKKLEEEMRAGVVSLSNLMEDGFKRVSTMKETRGAVSAAEDVAEKVKNNRITIDITNLVAQGLHVLSEQIDNLSNEIRQRGGTASPMGSTKGSNEPQDIPIGRESE